MTKKIDIATSGKRNNGREYSCQLIIQDNLKQQELITLTDGALNH